MSIVMFYTLQLLFPAIPTTSQPLRSTGKSLRVPLTNVKLVMSSCYLLQKAFLAAVLISTSNDISVNPGPVSNDFPRFCGLKIAHLDVQSLIELKSSTTNLITVITKLDRYLTQCVGRDGRNTKDNAVVDVPDFKSYVINREIQGVDVAVNFPRNERYSAKYDRHLSHRWCSAREDLDARANSDHRIDRLYCSDTFDTRITTYNTFDILKISCVVYYSSRPSDKIQNQRATWGVVIIYGEGG
ncbi:Hypothetical predicted protein, partial [Paramuricea clavata]